MERRKLDLKDLDEVISEIEKLHQEGYQKAGNWNLAMICNHCGLVIRGALEGFDFKAPLLYRVIGPLLLKKMIFKQRCFKEGLESPATIMPVPGKDEGTEIDQIKQLIQRLKNAGEELSPSPFLGKLSKQQWMDFNVIHCCHHLSFLIAEDIQSCASS